MGAQMLQAVWEKSGLIYAVDGSLWWAKTHAQVPTVDVLGNGRLRIYYSSRDADNKSRVGFFEADANDPAKVLYVHPEPILDLGPAGTFDDCGTMPSWLVKHEGKTYLYYIGWNVRNTVPYHNSVGLAVSDDGVNFRKCFAGPVMDRTAQEPYFCATSCVLVEGGVWRNWYLSCTEWRMVDGKQEPRYHLKYAESADGVQWERKGVVAIDYRDANEGGIVRASVLKHGGIYKMWYCYRSHSGYRSNPANSYRIGYAESPDGLVWTKCDDRSGIDVSPQGWDSFMLAYPHVVDIQGRLHMFYNGNGFGSSGIGYAVQAASQ
jgi:hypothetical protein